ncbi:mechanosensitive ion channel family protein [Catenovulum sp. 2E275]|uniref:mechanosensitive ion channel family protein n=1 Tax=Catenovulum sp. 2E275 TaxID=2980497 RepID=UPI0021D083F9|nr:mechanosensitive ion channel family protein [Catenovulum sp. 2E275]MCU4674658.1 mechanosensitive ion channel family protein [Catenovulum sp. 2E275]
MTYQKLIEEAEKTLISWMESAGSLLPNLVLSLTVMLLFLITSTWVIKGFRQILRRSLDSVEIINLLLALIKIFYLLLGAFIALDIIGLKGTVTSLLAGAGIVGLALGFAFQDMAENLIAGIFMGIRKPFKVGHIIECDSIFGTVKEINLRNTLVENFYGQVLIVPNKTLFRNTIKNYFLTATRRIEVQVGISYADDPEQAEQLLTDAINALDFVINKDDTIVFAESFGPSSVNLKVWFWIEYPGTNFLVARHKAVCVVKKTLEENDILIPFPITTLDFNAKGGTKLADVNQLKRDAENDQKITQDDTIDSSEGETAES